MAPYKNMVPCIIFISIIFSFIAYIKERDKRLSDKIWLSFAFAISTFYITIPLGGLIKYAYIIEKGDFDIMISALAYIVFSDNFLSFNLFLFYPIYVILASKFLLRYNSENIVINLLSYMIAVIIYIKCFRLMEYSLLIGLKPYYFLMIIFYPILISFILFYFFKK